MRTRALARARTRSFRAIFIRARRGPRDRRTKMSIYRFSKGGRLFVQGTRQDDPRDGVSPSPTGSRTADDLQAVYTKRRLSTEVLGSDPNRRKGTGFTSMTPLTSDPRMARGRGGTTSGNRATRVIVISREESRINRGMTSHEDRCSRLMVISRDDKK